MNKKKQRVWLVMSKRPRQKLWRHHIAATKLSTARAEFYARLKREPFMHHAIRSALVTR